MEDGIQNWSGGGGGQVFTQQKRGCVNVLAMLKRVGVGKMLTQDTFLATLKGGGGGVHEKFKF